MYEGKERDYEGENDAKTLHDAHHIRKDAKRHSRALKHLKKMGKHSTHALQTHAHETDAIANLKPGEGYQETELGDETGEGAREGSVSEERHESRAEARAEGD